MIRSFRVSALFTLVISAFMGTNVRAQGGDIVPTPYAHLQDGDTAEIKKFVRSKTGWWNSFRIGFGGDGYFLTIWPDDSQLLPKRLRLNDLFFSRDIIVSTDDRYAMFAQHPEASSRGFGGFPCFEVYYGAGNFILRKPGGDIHARPYVILATLDGIVRSLLFDTVGTFGYDLLATTELGSVYRIDHSGKTTKIANVNDDDKAADIVPLGAEYGPYAGQLLLVSRFFGKFRSVDGSGNVSEIDAGREFPGAEALVILPGSDRHEETNEAGSYILHWRILVQHPYVVNPLTIDAYALLAVIRRNRSEIWALRQNDSGFKADYLFDLPAQVDEITFLTPAHLPSGGTCPAKPTE